jgi:hypothetical protein
MALDNKSREVAWSDRSTRIVARIALGAVSVHLNAGRNTLILGRNSRIAGSNCLDAARIALGAARVHHNAAREGSIPASIVLGDGRVHHHAGRTVLGAGRLKR